MVVNNAMAIKRVQYWDFIKGIAILMVIANHTFSSVSYSSCIDIFKILVRQIINCAVPLFFAISGYLLSKKNLESRVLRSNFWNKQILKVYIPGLLWSLPLFLLAIRNGRSIMWASVNLICMGFSIYYFIAAIIQCYLLLPILNKVNYRKWGGGLCCASIVCGILIAWLSANKLPLIVYAGPCVTWIMFFCLGIYLGTHKCDYKLGSLVIGLIISIFLMMVESYILHKCGKIAYGLKPSVYVFSTIVILLLFSEKIQARYDESLMLNKVISYIGVISFGIYLTHCYWIMIIDIFFAHDYHWIVKWLLVSFASIVSIVFARKILPNKLLKYIGLQ